MDSQQWTVDKTAAHSHQYFPDSGSCLGLYQCVGVHAMAFDTLTGDFSLPWLLSDLARLFITLYLSLHLG